MGARRTGGLWQREKRAARRSAVPSPAASCVNCDKTGERIVAFKTSGYRAERGRSW